MPGRVVRLILVPGGFCSGFVDLLRTMASLRCGEFDELIWLVLIEVAVTGYG
jgi:hypothetical protein